MKKQMKNQPILETRRLILRPFRIDDAERVELLAGNKKIADVTATIPHPYPKGLAKEWISTHLKSWSSRERVSYAITLSSTGLLVGCISLMHLNSGEGELGYWVGVEYWDNGYCTEACKSIIDFGFNEIHLNSIGAKHFTRNPASGKVLTNCGLAYKNSGSEQIGNMKQIEDFKCYELLRIMAG